MSRGGGASRGGRSGGFASSSAFASAYASTPDLGQEPVQAPLKKTKELEVAPVGLFRKEINCSGRTPIKSSQAKKFKQLVADVYRHLSESELSQLFPGKCAIHTEKLAGPLLTEHKPLLYWVRDESLPSEGKNDIGAPLFIDLSGGHADAHMLYPTLYALAKVPTILRPIVTHPAVSRFAMQGADIMWPGVISPPDAEFGVGRFQQGEKRAVFARGNPVPYAVGWLSQDSPSVVASGKKGKAVSVVHVYADSLWTVGSREAPNIGFTPKQVYAITTAGGAQSDSEEEEEGDEEQEAQTEGVESADAAMAGLQVHSTDAASSSAAAAERAVPSSSDADAAPSSSDGAAPIADDEEQQSTDSVGAADAAGSASEDDDDGAPASSSPDALDGSADGTADAEAEGDVDVEDGDEGEGEGEEDDEDDSSSGSKANTSDMDDALVRCFLLAVQTRIRDSDLPLSSSALLTIMESCNVGGPVDRLEVRRSRYKKLARFIKALGKMGLAKSKMPLCKKGTCVQELTVMSVSRNSPMMQEVTVTQSLLDAMKKKQKALEKAHKSAAAGKKTSSSSAASASSSSSSGSGSAGVASSSGAAAASAGGSKGALQIIHMYKPDQKLQKYLFTSEDDSKKLWWMKDAKQVLWDYTRSNDLDMAGGQRVRLDPALYSTFYAETGRNVTDVLKSDLSQRFDSHMNEYHAIAFGEVDEQPHPDSPALKFVKGPVPCIQVSVEQRQGKKQMTKVQGVEIFGITPAVFARDAQKAFASSATTASVTVKHKTFEEVLIQGNVAGDVGIKLQQLYGIPQQLVKMQKKGK